MIPTGSKLWYGVSGFALVAAVVYFVASRGEERGAMVLASLAIAAFTLGLLSSLIGDGDVHAPQGADVASATEAAGTTVVTQRRTQLAAAWPALAALGAGVVVVGLATGGLLLYLGLALVVVAGVEWMVQAWAERATGDPLQNRQLRNRLMYPIEIPVFAALVIGLVIIAFSRVLLALPKAGSTIIAIVVAAAILGVAFLLTSRPHLSTSILTVVVALGAVALLGGGIVGAVVGEREFEHHEEEEGGEAGEEGSVQALISASSTDDFDEQLVNVPVGEPVEITFENNQGGVQHNVHIVEPVDLEPSPIITGPDSVTFEVTFEEEGEYTYVCDVHPNMEGTIQAVDQPNEDVGDEEDPDEGQEGGGAGVDDLGGDDS